MGLFFCESRRECRLSFVAQWASGAACAPGFNSCSLYFHIPILLDIYLLQARLSLHPQAHCFPDNLGKWFLSQPECKRCKSPILAMGRKPVRGKFYPKPWRSGGWEGHEHWRCNWSLLFMQDINNLSIKIRVMDGWKIPGNRCLSVAVEKPLQAIFIRNLKDTVGHDISHI